MTAEPETAAGHIVLIEDDMALRRAIHDYLEYAGFRVSLGAEAVGTDTADAIVADYRLPGGLKGTDAIASVRRRAGRDVPALLMTGDVAGAAVHDAAAMTAVKLLGKPVGMDVLVREIRALLNDPR